MKKIDILSQTPSKLADAASTEERYGILLGAFHRVIGGDAVALLRLEEKLLKIVACRGLSPDAVGRNFAVSEHPRFDVICNSRGAVVFPSDCSLADPYDGLIAGDRSAAARVHSCMGLPLFVNRRLIGVMTADALVPDAFANLDMPLIETLSVYAGAEMHTTQLIEALKNASERMGLISQQLVQDARWQRGGELVGDSEALKRLRHEIELVARSDFGVLIMGETGSGKEVVARAIHAASKRRDQPLLYLNCATLPNNLVESELFGHVRGAFTGASADRRGKLELADAGTLFLDEIGELPIDVQPKLLRFLQAGEVQPVGSNRTRKLNVRLLAATNRDLAEAVQKERFRADLFHRLNVYPIQVPPLREHLEDIPRIAGCFGEVVRRRLGVGAVRFRPDTHGTLLAYAWPGNVRELENVIARAVLRASAEAAGEELVVVAPHHLGSELASPERPPARRAGAGARITPSRPLRTAAEDIQRDLIRIAVENNNGNWAAAARELGINRSNLHKLAKRLGIKETR
jgi:anaerobic nitric oxide reductase transcription regulator